MQNKFLIFFIIFLGIFLRLYQLGNIPPGLNIDEASHGVNALSILETGKDRYGELLPFAFRSFGTYLLPLYTYLSTIPVAIFTLNNFSVCLVSVASGILLIFVTYFFFQDFKLFSNRLKILAVLLISISPWAIFFSRGGHEASLSLGLFILSILLFMKALQNPKWLILSLFFAGLSGLAYYSEKYLTLIFFPVAVYLFRKELLKDKKIILIGILVLFLTQLPQLSLLKSGAFMRRIEQVNYWNDQSFNQNSGDLRSVPFGKAIYIAKEFTSHYIEYFSPRSLFFDPDPQSVRSMSDMSIFYIWMIVPLWFGIKVLLKKISLPLFKVMALLLVVSPIPAALTIDPFYSIRALVLFWVLTMIIAFGSDYLLSLIPLKSMKITLTIILVLVSLISFYNSYFILIKYERSELFGYEYKQLIEKLNGFKSRIVVIDSRLPGAHIWIPYYGKIDPVKFQMQTSDFIKKNYYNNMDLDEITKLDNFEIRAINWENDIHNDEIIVGDDLAISEEQIREHKLIFLFQIIGFDGKVKLKAYDSNARENCIKDIRNGLMPNQNCKKYI